jgi:hypothetical protein
MANERRTILGPDSRARHAETASGKGVSMTDEDPGASSRLVQLRFKPLWLYVDAVREFCGFFARASGLPRIRYEGQVDLELSVTPGRVAITARGSA